MSECVVCFVFRPMTSILDELRYLVDLGIKGKTNHFFFCSY